jgi:hypothetical protein
MGSDGCPIVAHFGPGQKKNPKESVKIQEHSKAMCWPHLLMRRLAQPKLVVRGDSRILVGKGCCMWVTVSIDRMIITKHRSEVDSHSAFYNISKRILRRHDYDSDPLMFAKSSWTIT